MVGLPMSDKAHYDHKMVMDFPEGMVIVIDTRESDPLFHHGGKLRKGIPVVRKTLEFGDYSILGFETSFVVERKKQGDLFGCLGKQRDRFKKELQKMELAERKWILVEEKEEDIMQSYKWSKMHPNAVRQSIASIEVDFGIPFHYSGNRKGSEIWLVDRMIKYYRWKRGGKS